MVVKLTLGAQKKTGILGNSFFMGILKRYRQMGTYFYEGVSLTYLKNTASNQQERITKHPIYVTLQLLSQKLYWEQNETMIINKGIYSELVEKQLSHVMDTIRTQYKMVYPEFKLLRERVDALSTLRERNDMQLLLSIQMKRLRGEKESTLSVEERTLLERFERTESKQSTFTVSSEALATHLETDIKEMQNPLTEERLISDTDSSRDQIPVLWKLYQEAIKTRQIQQGENWLADANERLFVFLNTFQEGSQEERIEFRRFLNSEINFLNEKKDKNENLVMLLQKNPQRLLEILEQWQERKANEQKKISIINVSGHVNNEHVINEQTTSEKLISEQFANKKLLEEHLLNENIINSIFADEVLSKRIFENENFVKEIIRDEIFKHEIDKKEIDKNEIYNIENIKAAILESEYLKKAIIEKVMKDDTFISEILRSELFQKNTLESENFRKEILENEVFVKEILSNETLINEVLTNEVFLKEARENQIFLKEIFASEQFDRELSAKEGIFKDGMVDARRELIHHLTENRTLTEMQELQRSLLHKNETQQELLHQIYSFFSSKQWKQMTESGSLSQYVIQESDVYEKVDSRRSIFNSVEISKERFHETENIRMGILNHLSSISEAERLYVLQGYRERISNQALERNMDVIVPEIEKHEWIHQASRQELDRLLQYLLTYSSLEAKEQLMKLTEKHQIEEGRIFTTGELRSLSISNQEILERPYSYVFRKRKLMEAIRHGSEQELSQIYTYMRMNRMLDRGLTAQYPEGLRSVLHHHVQKLTEEQITSVVENVVWDIQEIDKLRRLEAGEEIRLLRRQQTYQSVSETSYMEQHENAIVYKSAEKIQHETERVEQTLENYNVIEKQETKRLKQRQELSVKMLSEQSEELRKLKETVEEQTEAVEALKKRQAPELDRNELYRDMMKRMERQLHLERQRRGLD